MQRLCVECLESWVTTGIHCEACLVSFEKHRKAMKTVFGKVEPGSIGFEGPTIKDVNPEDIEFGYHVEYVRGQY